jgi:hypothetical protein
MMTLRRSLLAARPPGFRECLGRSVRLRRSVSAGAGLLVIGAGVVALAADAGTKTLIDYFQPTPIVCPPMCST